MIKKMFKSKKFLKAFLIPYGIWFLLTLIAMIPEEAEIDPLTWGDFVLVNFTVAIIWFLLLLLVYSVISFIKKKSKNEKIKCENKEPVIQENKIKEKLEDNINKEIKNQEEKCLYSLESVIDSKEYGKMSKYFPEIYWSYVIYGTFFNLIMTLLIHICFDKLRLTIQFFIIVQLFIMLFYKAKIETIAFKYFKRLKLKVDIERKQKHIKNYKFVKLSMIILFIFTILSIWFALGTMSLLPVDGSDYGFLKNTWVLWIWLPIPVLSYVLGIIYKKRGIKCNKNIVAGLLVGILLLIYGSFFIFFSSLNNFDNSLFIITRNEQVDSIKYYEVNYKGNKREVKKIESEVEEIFNARNCFDSFIKNGDIGNQLTLDTCNIEDEENNSIEVKGELKNIIESVPKVQQDHDIFEVKILKVKNDYYVVLKLNVNFWTPYELYHYDNKTKVLNEIITFSNEDVIGIKLK